MFLFMHLATCLKPGRTRHLLHCRPGRFHYPAAALLGPGTWGQADFPEGSHRAEVRANAEAAAHHAPTAHDLCNVLLAIIFSWRRWHYSVRWCTSCQRYAVSFVFNISMTVPFAVAGSCCMRPPTPPADRPSSLQQSSICTASPAVLVYCGSKTACRARAMAVRPQQPPASLPSSAFCLLLSQQWQQSWKMGAMRRLRSALKPVAAALHPLGSGLS